MLTEVTVWTGSMLSTYQDEVKSWTRKFEEADILVERVECSDVARLSPNGKLSLDGKEAIRLLVESLTEESFWEDAPRTVLLYSPHLLPIDSFREIINGIIEASTKYVLGVVVTASTTHHDKVFDKLADLDGVKYTAHSRGIPVDVDERAEWAIEFLSKYDVKVPKKALLRLFDVAGDDVGASVSSIVSTAELHKGEEITANDLIGGMPLGAVNDYEAIKAIIGGDSEGAYDVLQRMEKLSFVYLATLLMGRFRTIAVVHEAGADAALESGIVKSTGALHYIKADLRRIDVDTARDAMIVVQQGFVDFLHNNLGDEAASVTMVASAMHVLVYGDEE